MTPEAAAAIIRAWLNTTMRETGMTVGAWAKRAGVSPSTISRARSEDYAFVTSSRTLAKLAAVANRPPPELNLSGIAQIQPHFLQVRHRVQAGNWVEADAEMQVIIDNPRPVAPDPRFSNIEQWLELVVGDSINLRIPDGGFAHVVDAIGIYYEPKDGDLVVVERTRGGGLLRERTIKQIVMRPDGTPELWPQSTNTRHRPLIMTEGARDGEDVTVQIVGVVIGSYIAFR